MTKVDSTAPQKSPRPGSQISLVINSKNSFIDAGVYRIGPSTEGIANFNNSEAKQMAIPEKSF
jgi:hypothetical protein